LGVDTTKRDDIALWRAWKASGSNQDLEALMKQLAPLLRRETARWSAIVPMNMLDNEAKRLTIEALKTYDPAQSALGTHVTYRLQKLSRIGYARQSTLAVPEQKRLLFNQYDRAKKQLEDLHGRPPNLDEIADHMRLPPKYLQNVIDVVGRREFMESGDGPVFVQHMDDPEVVHLAYHSMTPVQQQVFQMRTGYMGAQVLPGHAIMKATGLTQGQLSYQLGAIKKTLTRAINLR
jgi:DNA-directed RNA polymerase specialized sigma subunit